MLSEVFLEDREHLYVICVVAIQLKLHVDIARSF